MIKTIKRLKKAHLNKLYSYFVDGYSWLDIFMICTLAFEGGMGYELSMLRYRLELGCLHLCENKKRTF